MRRAYFVLALVTALCLVAAPALLAQAKKSAEPTTDELDKAIRDQIAAKAKATGGKFQVKDNVLHKTWSLELVKVHKDKLTPLSDTRYFACVDFKADDGTAVDVDFYMDYKSGKFSLTDITVHKINGKPRFMYEQKGDVWVRVPVQEKKSS